MTEWVAFLHHMWEVLVSDISGDFIQTSSSLKSSLSSCTCWDSTSYWPTTFFLHPFHFLVHVQFYHSTLPVELLLVSLERCVINSNFHAEVCSSELGLQWEFFMWLTILSLRPNFLAHVGHWYGVSPECIFWWRSKLLAWLKHLVHCGQGYGRSPVCLLLCLFKSPVWLNTLPQNSQHTVFFVWRICFSPSFVSCLLSAFACK